MRLLLSNILLFSNFMDFFSISLSLSRYIKFMCWWKDSSLSLCVHAKIRLNIVLFSLLCCCNLFVTMDKLLLFIWNSLEIDRNKDGWEMKSKNWKLFHFTFSSHLYDVFKFFWLKKLFDHSCLLHLCIIIATSRNQRRKFTPI